MAGNVALPPGFVLDEEPPQSNAADLPPGFVLDAHQEQEVPKGSVFDYVLEPAKAVIGELGGTAIAGAKGVWDLAGTESVEEAVKSIDKAKASMPDFSPETQRGQVALEKLGDLMQAGVDIANFPISGLAGLASLLSGGNVDEAVKTIKQVQGDGLGKTLGDKTFEATGSPLAATAAMMAPDVALAVAGGTAGRKVADSAEQAVKRVGSKVALRRTPKGLIDPATNYPTPAFAKALKQQGMTFDDIIDEVPRLADDLDPKAAVNSIIKRKIRAGDTDGALASKMVSPSGTIVDDDLAKEAIRQGMRPGDVQAIKQAGPGSKAKMEEMLRVKRRTYRNERLGQDRRPTDVIGDSVASRFDHIRQTADNARLELDNIARNQLARTPINVDDVSGRFFDELNKLDVAVDRSTLPPTVQFRGSMIAKDRTSQRVIKDVLELLAEPSKPNALRAHKLKRQLDTMIDFRKKSAGGLTEAGRNLAKSVRAALNDSIRAVSDDYARVNDTLSTSISSLDDFQRVLGPSVDVFADGANKAIGQDLRGLLSNRKSRVKLENAVNRLDSVARDMGGAFDDDIGDLVHFANVLDDQFGAAARTSLRGDVEAGIKAASRGKAGAVEAVVNKIAEKAESARGINDPAALRVIDEILRRGAKKEASPASMPYRPETP